MRHFLHIIHIKLCGRIFCRFCLFSRDVFQFETGISFLSSLFTEKTSNADISVTLINLTVAECPNIAVRFFFTSFQVNPFLSLVIGKSCITAASAKELREEPFNLTHLIRAGFTKLLDICLADLSCCQTTHQAFWGRGVCFTSPYCG